MIPLDIEGNKHKLLTRWDEVTLDKYVEAWNFILSLPSHIYDFLYAEEKPEVNDDEILIFYIDWICLFSDIPKEVLENGVKVTDESDFSLISLFKHVSRFLFLPDKIDTFNYFEHKGKRYELINSLSDKDKAKKLMDGATFKHFKESAELKELIGHDRTFKPEYLCHLTALLYRESGEQGYVKSKIEKRQEDFKDLPMITVFGAYFFLFERTNKLLNDTKQYLQEQVEEQQRKRKKPLIVKLLKGFIGIFKRWIWRKKAI